MAEAKKRRIDFSNVKDGKRYSQTHVEEGDFKFKIVGVEEVGPDDDGDFRWDYELQLVGRASSSYPYRCKLVENQLWKLRNLFVAAGKTVPKKAVNVDPTGVIGSIIGGTASDDEYGGRLRSVIDTVFPADLVADSKASSKTKRKTAEPEDDEDVDVDEDEADEDDLDLEDL